VEKSRKQMKERKNRAKKIRGVKKVWTFALIRLLCPNISVHFECGDFIAFLWKKSNSFW
jgi:hypothetical protein